MGPSQDSAPLNFCSRAVLEDVCGGLLKLVSGVAVLHKDCMSLVCTIEQHQMSKVPVLHIGINSHGSSHFEHFWQTGGDLGA